MTYTATRPDGGLDICSEEIVNLPAGLLTMSFHDGALLGMAPKTLTWYKQSALSGMHATCGPYNNSTNAKVLKTGCAAVMLKGAADAVFGKGVLNALSGVAEPS